VFCQEEPIQKPKHVLKTLRVCTCYFSFSAPFHPICSLGNFVCGTTE